MLAVIDKTLYKSTTEEQHYRCPQQPVEAHRQQLVFDNILAPAALSPDVFAMGHIQHQAVQQGLAGSGRPLHASSSSCALQYWRGPGVLYALPQHSSCCAVQHS